MSFNSSAFLSYTHFDNDSDGGQIARLVEVVKAEYEMVAGENLEIFFDRQGIDWGDDWERKIDDAIASSAFFIPIVTPRYLQSDSCRKEFLRFVGQVESLNLTKLILPLLWIPTPEITGSSNSNDEVVQLIRKYQWRDLSDARFEEPTSRAFRRSCNSLASHLRTRSEELSAIDVAPVEPSDAEDAPGLIEVLADGEDGSEHATRLLETIGAQIALVGTIMESASEEMAEADAKGQGIKARMRIANKIALDLEDPATKINWMGADLITAMRRWDSALRALFESSEMSVQSDDRDEMLRGLIELHEAAGPSLAEVREMQEAAEGMYGLSRSMRKPLTTMNTGLRSVRDSEELIREWAARARSILDGRMPPGA